MSESKQTKVAPASGKLAVLLPGMGAVATTFIAGVEAARKKIATPIGSLTQLGHIRLGKRSEKRWSKISDLVPLAKLDDLVFGGWDPIADDAYTAASRAKVLSPEHLSQLKPFLETIKPMPAVFEQKWVKRLEGKHVKPSRARSTRTSPPSRRRSMRTTRTSRRARSTRTRRSCRACRT